jgi:epoxide hydrolase-like predicted phosphatase
MCHVVVRAVVFDVGGVLERVEEADAWLSWCRDLLGLSDEEFRSAYARVDPRGSIGVGGLTEVEYWREWSAAFGLTTSQTDEVAAAFWDWYCGEPDDELLEYAATLRSTHRVAILSNSAPGAREQEQARYGFAETFDPIVYSHEVGLAKPDRRIYALTCERLGVRPDQTVFLDDTPACVEGATAYGMHALLHRDTASSIAAIDGLIGAADRHGPSFPSRT